MHPNPLFRSTDRAQLARLVDDIGFASIFLATPDGPRVAHAPVITEGDDGFLFHLSRGNALSAHLDGAHALMVVNGPHGYVSPRWYADRATVPTWDYVAVEIEGTVSRLSDEALEAQLHRLIERSEARIAGAHWDAGESPDDLWARLFRGIAGFRMDAREWRPTLKLSQKRSEDERVTIADGIERGGNAPLARLMRSAA